MSLKKIGITLFGIAILAILIIGFWGPSYQFDNTIKVAENTGKKYFDFIQSPTYFNSWKSNYIKSQPTEEKGQYFLSTSENDETYHRLESFDFKSKDSLSINILHSYYENTITLSQHDSSSILIQQEISGTGFFENIFMPIVATQIATEYLNDFRKASNIYSDK